MGRWLEGRRALLQDRTDRGAENENRPGQAWPPIAHQVASSAGRQRHGSRETMGPSLDMPHGRNFIPGEKAVGLAAPRQHDATKG